MFSEIFCSKFLENKFVSSNLVIYLPNMWGNPNMLNMWGNPNMLNMWGNPNILNMWCNPSILRHSVSTVQMNDLTKKSQYLAPLYLQMI